MRAERDRFVTLTSRRIIIAATVWSILVTTVTIAFLRRLSREHPVSPVERPNEFPQPPVSAEAPPHFTENIIVPGFTETGEQILQDDAEQGRSPEGV